MQGYRDDKKPRLVKLYKFKRILFARYMVSGHIFESQSLPTRIDTFLS